MRFSARLRNANRAYCSFPNFLVVLPSIKTYPNDYAKETSSAAFFCIEFDILTGCFLLIHFFWTKWLFFASRFPSLDELGMMSDSFDTFALFWNNV